MTLDHCYIGDCRDVMRDLIAAGVKVQTVVTSPPYYGLRDYGTGQWEGGSPDCDHLARTPNPHRALHEAGANSPTALAAALEEKAQHQPLRFRDVCRNCGARRIDQQLGLEETPEEYVAAMVGVFRFVRELLADDGTLWLNLGDSYCSQGGGKAPGLYEDKRADGATWQPARRGISGLKPKDLVGIPWRVAFALQADGWWLRNDIIWSKPNPMPESVTDRCTKSHEYLFLLSKQESYYFDAEAIKEPFATDPRENYPARARIVGRGEQGAASARGGDRDKSGGFPPGGAGRNKRTVWTVPTTPFAGAHFAVFPEKLIEPCILAGSRSGDVVFDPFMGAGTVAAVASHLGRRWLGAELNSKYVELQKPRAAQQAMPL